LQPIAERERGMVEIARRHLDVVDLEGALDQVVIADRGAELVECDREITVLHLPGERFAQGLAESFGAINVPFVARLEQRREEWNALDVIPMGMTDQDVSAPALSARHQRRTKRARAGAAIDDDERAARRSYFDARRVSAVTSGARTGRRYRTARAPEFYSHTGLALQANSGCRGADCRFHNSRLCGKTDRTTGSLAQASQL